MGRLSGARWTERRAMDWERLRTTENDWEARQRDCGTARPRDCGTERPAEKKHRRSQAFSGVLSRAEPCEAAWRQSGAAVALIKKLGWMDSTLTYIPFSPMIEASLMRRYHAKLSRQAF